MDYLRVFLISVFLYDCVHSASINADEATPEMCGFPPVPEKQIISNACSVDNLSDSLKTICYRLSIESDCYFPEKPRFPLGVFISDIKNGTLAVNDEAAKPVRLDRNCQYMVERRLMNDQDCHDVCGSDLFLFCDVFVSMEITLKNYFVQEVRENGTGYRNLDIFVHKGIYKFLFPYPIQESFHVSLGECLKPKEHVANDTVTVCSMLGEIAVEFVKTGKNFSMSTLDYLQNVTASPWDPCEEISYFAKSSLPGVQVFKDQDICRKTCNEKASHICQTVVLGLQFLAKKSNNESEDVDLVNSEKQFDTQSVVRSQNTDPDKTVVEPGTKEGEGSVLADAKHIEDKKEFNKTTEIPNKIEVEPEPELPNTNPNNDTAITGTSKNDDELNNDKKDDDNGESETNPGKTDSVTDVIPNVKGEKTNGKEGTNVTSTDKSGNADGVDGLNPVSSNKETPMEETKNEGIEIPESETKPGELNPEEVTDKDTTGTETEKDQQEVETPKEETGSTDTVTEQPVNKKTPEVVKEESKAHGSTASYTSLSTASSTSSFSEEVGLDNDLGFPKEDSPIKPAQASDEKFQPKEKVDDIPVNKQSETVSGDSYEDEEVTGGHFMAYFLVFIVVCVAGYIVFHNKQKIIALVIEGKGPGGGRRPATKEYKRLKTEDVMPSLEKSAYSKNYVF